MTWNCRCGDIHEDSERLCYICGMTVTRVLVLQGALGQRKFTIEGRPIPIGNRIYSSLVGPESQYAASSQFNLEKGSDGDWYITACPKTVNATLVNDTLCEDGTPIKLQDGDVIKIGSRVDLSRNFAHLSVSFEIKQ